MFNFFNDELMKKMYEEWEKTMSAHLEKMVHDQGFVSEMAKAMAATMTGKAMASKAMDESFTMMNLPTRTEMIKALQKLTDLEERILDLTEKFDDFVAETKAARGAMQKSLDRIEERLHTHQGSTEAPEQKQGKKGTRK